MAADAASRPHRRTVLRAGTALAAAAGLTACADIRHDAAAAPVHTEGVGSVGTAGSEAVAAYAPDWAALTRSLHGPVIRPGDSRYTAAQHLFQPRYDGVHPAAVAYPASAADVAACVSFARKYRLPLSARNGGHSYGGWSKAAGGLVVDLGRLNTVRTVPGGAVVGAGARLIDVYSQLNAHGVTIPAGSCPTVGVTGLTLGGGVGVTGRAYGLTCDNLTGAQIVTAAGRILDVDATHHADLFWALRGAAAATSASSPNCASAPTRPRTAPTPS
ncbi:FAD-dependent oxidoreductase [Streptacidiphilus monticola]